MYGTAKIGDHWYHGGYSYSLVENKIYSLNYGMSWFRTSSMTILGAHDDEFDNILGAHDDEFDNIIIITLFFGGIK